MLKTLLKIYDFFNKHFSLLIVLLIALFVFFGFFASKISLKEDISGFLPQTPENEKINYLYNNISIADKIVVRFTVNDTLADEDVKETLLMDATDRFVGFLDSVATDEYIKNIQYQVDQESIIELTRFLTVNMPYFMRESDYVRMDSILANGDIAHILENDRSLILSPMGMGVKENIMLDPMHFSGSVLLRLKEFQISDNYKTVGDYIFTKDGNSAMAFIESANPMSETKRNAYLAECIENAVKILPSDVHADYFGGNIVAVTNSERVKKDALYSMIAAVGLILLLLVYYFRNARALAIIMLSVLFGGVVSLAAMYFIQDTMSAIALGAASIIFGISVDYVMPFLIYKTYEPNSRKSLKTIFLPLLISNITTVGAFLSLLFLRAGSMRDFGLMASIALISTLIFVLVFVPHISGKIISRPWQLNFSDKLSQFEPDGNKAFVIALFVMTIIMFCFSGKVSFESDMQKINYMTDSQRKQFAELSNITPLGKKSLYYVTDGKTLNEALSNYEKQIPMLDKISTDANVTKVGIGDFMPSDSLQKIKLNKWHAFWSQRAPDLIKQIEANIKRSGFKEGAFDKFYEIITKQYAVEPLCFFDPVRNALLKEYIIEKEDRAMVVNLLYMTPDVSDKVESELSQAQGGFVFNSGSMIRSMVSLLADDFNYVLFICMGVVFLSLIIAFGRIELSVIAFIPMIVSWFWILGIMGIAGIKFNIINIVLATFIFGLGNDYDVFITNGLMYKYGYGRKSINAFKVSILMSALTMIIGIGVLAFAKHPAMKSLGQVTVIGMISVVCAAYIITPLFFKYLVYKRGLKREVPVTFKNALYSIYAFSYFLIGSVILRISGFFMLKVGKATEEHKLRLHKMIAAFCGFAAKYIPNVKYRQEGVKEDFTKPAVIIFNHQSHLDLMYVLQFSPKIVILTNEWVWNSPFYGAIVKYAEFYPIMNGVENCVDHLKSFIERGYSIAVFPEGTRSENCTVKRFHRGAFYLAEKLNIDILPIVFHGVGHVLPKKELLLREGSVTAKILPRITHEDMSFGEGYVERTKAIRKMFICEYEKISAEKETFSYFEYLVRHNYIYKGPKQERIARKELAEWKRHEKLMMSFPRNGKVLINNCGIGVFTLMCALIRKDLTVIGCDNDPENIALASNCASVPDRLHYFVNEEIPEMTFDAEIDILFNR